VGATLQRSAELTDDDKLVVLPRAGLRPKYYKGFMAFVRTMTFLIAMMLLYLTPRGLSR
jgi:hypothetical protein